MTRLLIPALVTVALGAAACGAQEAAEPAASAATVTPTATTTPASAAQTEPAPKARPARRGTKIKLVDSQFGRILADGRGQAVYLFDKEKTKRSECYGGCATAWPPVYAKGRPVAGRGAKQRLLGTTRRRDGRRQVTYRGRPLYFYVDDRPGVVLCHNVFEFGGLWLVVRGSGRPVP